MSKIETLTAYKCKFSYLQRNNPLKEKFKEDIKNGSVPLYSFSDFLKMYQKHSEKLAIGENSDRAIYLDESNIRFIKKDEIKMWHLFPGAGKQGKPVTIMRKTGKKYNFKSDVVALYDYQFFVYESNNEIIAIFHRQNNSGCKSVFLETANKALKSIGLKLEMELIFPINDEMQNALPTKLTLQYKKEIVSSDIADNIKKSKKEHIIREVYINLQDEENKSILDIFKKFHKGDITQAEAFVLLNADLKNSVKYNDAKVKFNIGKHSRSVQWSELEKILGAVDITIPLHTAFKESHDFSLELKKLADEYYNKIIESGEV